MATYSVTGYYLELRSAAHQKFYQVLIAENNVLVKRWGRIGAPMGQCTVTSFGSYEDAEDQGKKSLFEKRAKGYSEVSQRTFQVDQWAIDEARRENLGPILQAYQKAAAVPDFEVHSTTVLGTYEKFAGRVQTLMDKATRGEGEVLDVFDELNDLKKVWAGIEAKHAEVQTAMNITEAAVTRALLDGKSVT